MVVAVGHAPDQVDLAKLRESKESIASLLRETDAMADAVGLDLVG